MFKKISKIIHSICNEGLIPYLRRLDDLGRYRFYVRRLIYFKNLHENYAKAFGRILYLPQREAGIKEELLLYGIHEPFATSIYQKLLNPGDIVFDIGSNCGYYLAVADSALNGNCTIYSFEADPELANLVQRNSESFLANIHSANLAISDRVGKVAFHVSEVSNWGSLLAHSELRLIDKINVDSISIDRFCRDIGVVPTVMRMDIEGGEIFALRGAKDVLPYVRVLFLELHCAFLGKQDLIEILDILQNGNFGKVVYFNRYYDWPWSRPDAAKKTMQEGDLIQFEKIVLSDAYPVISAFFLKSN